MGRGERPTDQARSHSEVRQLEVRFSDGRPSKAFATAAPGAASTASSNKCFIHGFLAWQRNNATGQSPTSPPVAGLIFVKGVAFPSSCYRISLIEQSQPCGVLG